ncbi:MAG: Hsp20/alpha crystallin family protein [Phycisphaerae bacterium]|jgi:HSP20 family protein|nr:Hsp20/alpha crystallin family protein [Phycisphaerae bacterium]MCZ2398958.1 Hsp20/alpha crystallin family protein [Phycisphaerae bacterium]
MGFDKFGKDPQLDDWSQKIRDIMDEMLNRSFVDFRNEGAWQPATNVYETATHLHICVELAGVEEHEIDLKCTGQQVELRGLRRSPAPPGVDGPRSVYVLEINDGEFRRVIGLPEPVEVEQVEATYSRGYLWIRLPRKKRG